MKKNLIFDLDPIPVKNGSARLCIVRFGPHNDPSPTLHTFVVVLNYLSHQIQPSVQHCHYSKQNGLNGQTLTTGMNDLHFVNGALRPSTGRAQATQRRGLLMALCPNAVL